MSFFRLSDGSDALATGNTFEMGGGDMEPIPKNTDVLAVCDEAKWGQAEDTGENFINLRWSVLAPAEYVNRKVFQKVRVESGDSKKADKARRMLAAIDANAGGKLAKANEEPSNDSMGAALLNKPMVLKLGLWEMDDKKGNWVMAVSPRKAGGAPLTAAAKAQLVTPPTAKQLASDYDSDIGF